MVFYKQTEGVKSREIESETLRALKERRKAFLRSVCALKNVFLRSKQPPRTNNWLPVEFQQQLQDDRELASYVTSCSYLYQFDEKGTYSRPTVRTISDLPPEIIVVIASNLPLSVTIAWSLTSKYFHDILARESITKINETTPCLEILLQQAKREPKPFLDAASRERQKLLSLLDRDDLKLVFCFFCQKLHKPLAPRSPVYQTLSAYPCTFARYGSMSCNVIFNISQVRMAMKLFHKGIDPSAHLKFLAISTKCPRLSSTTRMIPQIIGFKLYMKVIHNFKVPFDPAKLTWYDGTPLPLSKFPNWRALNLVPHCPQSGVLLEAETMVRKAQDKPKSILKSRLMQCPECKTEYEILVLKATIDCAIVQRTSWHDLGEGDMPFWNPRLMSQLKSLTDVGFSSEIGVIKYIFENF